MEIKTSDTSPIRVDFVLNGRLGLTFAPGKRGPSLVGRYRWERDVAKDVARLADHYDIDLLVTLIEAHEFEQLAVTGLRDAVRAAGIESHWFPIEDRGVPMTLPGFATMIGIVKAALSEGERVVVHCRGGLGRAGTVAASVLVAQGSEADAAIRTVREARPGAIENEAQEQFVARFEDFWHGQGTE